MTLLVLCQLVNLFPRYYREQLPDLGQVNKYSSGLDVVLSGAPVASKSSGNITSYSNIAGKQLTPEDKAVQELVSKAGLDLNLTGKSTEKAGQLTERIVQDLGISKEKAAAIVGNFMHESGDFQHMQEINPVSGRGGYGWAQWTGPRRRNFEEFAAARGLDINSDEANYQFFLHEIQNDPYEKQRFEQWKNTDFETLAAETAAFEDAYERAGVKHHGSRIQRAEAALNSYDYRLQQLEANANNQPTPVTPNFDPAMLDQLDDRLKKWYENSSGTQKKNFEDALAKLGTDQFNEEMKRQPINSATIQASVSPTGAISSPNFEDQANGIRSLPIPQDVKERMIYAQEKAGIPRIVSFSGGQIPWEEAEAMGARVDPKTKNWVLPNGTVVGTGAKERHSTDVGAADLMFYDEEGNLMRYDNPRVLDFMKYNAAAGNRGIGAGRDHGEYMGPYKVHVGAGEEGSWGGADAVIDAQLAAGKELGPDEFIQWREKKIAEYEERVKRETEQLEAQATATAQQVQASAAPTSNVAPPALASGGVVDVPPGENVEIRKRDTGEVLAYANDRENIRVEPGELEGSQEKPRPTQEDIAVREAPIRKDPVSQRVMYKENPDPEFGNIVTAETHYTPSSYERATLSATLRPERNIHFAPSKHT
jgi:hypothetical protein